MKIAAHIALKFSLTPPPKKKDNLCKFMGCGNRFEVELITSAYQRSILFNGGILFKIRERKSINAHPSLCNLYVDS